MNRQKFLAIVGSSYLSLWSILIPAKAEAFVVKTLGVCRMPHSYWTTVRIKQYARDTMLNEYGWGRSEYKALNKLWTKESHWNPMAINPITSEGLHAQGIPQMLRLNRHLPAPQQVERGLAYISNRYGKPSIAWSYERSHGWY